MAVNIQVEVFLGCDAVLCSVRITASLHRRPRLDMNTDVISLLLKLLKLKYNLEYKLL
jgi:hypothetical protein